MKLRRAMAAAAATAVIAPVALLSAPAAFAAEETAPPSSNASAAPEETQEDGDETAAEQSPAPEEGKDETSVPEGEDKDGDDKDSEDKDGDDKDPEDEPGDEPPLCEDTKVDVSIKGLPGKIAAGSGWHKFTLNVANNSDSTLTDLDYFAGASPDKDGEDLFKTRQVHLQAWNPEDNVWDDLDSDGYAVGYVGTTDVLEPDYEVNIPLRINVKANAPVGAGFSLGATIYGDGDGECVGVGGVSYKFQIVSAGTNTDGTKPQVGGKAPIADTKPDSTTPKLEGTLAATGSNSALPMIGLIGGAAVAAGAGAIVLVRRRKAGEVA